MEVASPPGSMILNCKKVNTTYDSAAIMAVKITFLVVSFLIIDTPFVKVIDLCVIIFMADIITIAKMDEKYKTR